MGFYGSELDIIRIFHFFTRDFPEIIISGKFHNQLLKLKIAAFQIIQIKKRKKFRIKKNFGLGSCII
ncbi:hypothetical protein DLD82_14560 [Methanospirillum stamsii]|uniref:Uncharacterized protein n=1 Tax=Methanospirillum stamsii TaxID=1277351 RepID=A0A2V2MRG2_9EURY|nr:hypothetical protein DLD82_14560 [Methanospirillum stamsii]